MPMPPLFPPRVLCLDLVPKYPAIGAGRRASPQETLGKQMKMVRVLAQRDGSLDQHVCTGRWPHRDPFLEPWALLRYQSATIPNLHAHHKIHSV